MIDFHCHLDLYPNPNDVVAKCRDQGLYVLSVTTTPSAWEGTEALRVGCHRIRTALGLHPEIAHQRKGELLLFEQLLPEVRYVGEVGLDGSPELEGTWATQIEVFERILEMCSDAKGRVLSIHSRRAARPVLDLLEAYPCAGTPVLHWYSGSRHDLDRAVAMGCWFSVGPAMTRSARGRELIARMPRTRVLTETDGPFTRNGRQPLMPGEVGQAVSFLAESWSVDSGCAAKQVRDNLRRLVTTSEGRP